MASPTAAAALPLTGSGNIYAVALPDDGQAHLTTGVDETLCNLRIGGGARPVAAFGPSDCSTCRRMARARGLTVIDIARGEAATGH